MLVISAKQIGRRRVLRPIELISGVMSFVGVITVVTVLLSIIQGKVWAEGGSAAEPIIVRGYNVARGVNTLGSLSILCPAKSPFVLLSTERPGDSLMMSVDLITGPMQPVFPTAEGSEHRFGGEGDFFSVPRYNRLCLKRTEAGWILLCGVGEIRTLEGTFRLNRTYEDCLALLKHNMPELREGAARDIGRIAWEQRQRISREKTTQILIPFLNDSSAEVRWGTIEGLGLLCTREALEHLRQLADKTRSEEGKEPSTEHKRVLEALSIIAGTRLLGFTEVADLLTIEDAAKLYLEGATDWVDECPLSQRVNENIGRALQALKDLSNHPSRDVRLAVVRLLKLVGNEEAKAILQHLSTDPDEKVKVAAKEVLGTK